MKKFAMCALVAAMVLALAMPAIAETKIGGSYRVRGVYWDQGLDSGKFGGALSGTPGVGRYFDNRLRLNIDSKVTDNLAVHFEADSGLGYNGRNGDFQNPAATPDSYDGLWNGGGSFVNLPTANAADRDVSTADGVGHDIVFQQAYMDFATPIGAFSLGRQWSFWGMGLMVGENRNRLAWSYKTPCVQMGLGYDKFLESSGGNTGAFTRSDDIDNYFMWALYNGPNFQVGPYFEYSHADTTSSLTNGVFSVPGGNLPSDALFGVNTYGLSLYGNANLGPLALSAEAAYRGGSGKDRVTNNSIDVNGYAVVARGTYELPAVTLGAEGGYISGQDRNKADEITAFVTPFSFSPFAILGEFAINGMDVLGNNSSTTSYSDFDSNMAYGKLFIQGSPMPKLDAYASIGYAGAAQDRIDATSQKRSQLGTEVDLSLTYAITPNLSYNFTGGILFTGDWYKQPAAGGFGTAEKENTLLAVHSITVNF